MAECWAESVHRPLSPCSWRATTQEVRRATCYIRSAFLSVTSVKEFPLVCACCPLMIRRSPGRPQGSALEKPTGCVAAVEVEGTSLAKMADPGQGPRALPPPGRCGIAERGACTTFHSFRIGIGYAFDDRLQGWNRRSDDAYELNIDRAGVKELFGHPALSRRSMSPTQTALSAPSKSPLAADRQQLEPLEASRGRARWIETGP